MNRRTIYVSEFVLRWRFWEGATWAHLQEVVAICPEPLVILQLASLRPACPIRCREKAIWEQNLKLFQSIVSLLFGSRSEIENEIAMPMLEAAKETITSPCINLREILSTITLAKAIYVSFRIHTSSSKCQRHPCFCGCAKSIGIPACPTSFAPNVKFQSTCFLVLSSMNRYGSS